MDLGLAKRKLDFYDNVYDSCAMHEETIEIIVPDTSPDVVRIAYSDGLACVKDKSVNNSALTVTGTVKGAVHYFAENETGLRKLEISLPFSHTFESAKITSDSDCIVTATLISMESREINSRKLAVRAQIAINLSVYSKKVAEFCCDIPESNDYCVEMLKNTKEIYTPCAVKEKSFTIVDDIELTRSGADFEYLLNSNVSLSCNEMKIIGTKAILKGNAKIKCMYNTKSGEIEAMSYELPYSHIMDIDSAEENCDLTVKMNLRAAEIEPAHDVSGDTRYLTVNILVDACAIAFKKEEFETIDDLYSTSNEIETRFEETAAYRLCEHTSKRVSVNETIETANLVKRVVDVNVILEPTTFKENKITNDAQIKVYYIGEDGLLYCVTRRCPVECITDITSENKCMCDTLVTGESANGMSREIAVRFYVDYDIRVLAKTNVKSLCALSVIEKRRSSEKEASVIIKYVYRDKTLWEIAKSHNTTMDKIAEANGLEPDETVEAGSMLLIPLKG